jgi:hypothetical protein
MLVCLMGGLAFCTSATTVTQDSADNPYQSIIDRNVFSLKPPPPPPEPIEANKPQTLKITLTGITTVLGNKRVLMKTAPPPVKPGEPPKTDQSYILTEGQREGDIEVIEIDEKAGSVKVNNGGTVQTLTFEKDGAKLPATAAPPAAPGAAPASTIPGLPGVRGIPQPAGAQTPSFQLPSRIPRLPGSQPGTGQMGGPGMGMPMNNTQSPVPGTQTSLEEQTLLIEAARAAGGPGASLLPPTPLNPRANVLEPPGQGNPGSGTPTINLPPLPGRTLPPPPGQY